MNALNADLTNKVVVLKKEALPATEHAVSLVSRERRVWGQARHDRPQNIRATSAQARARAQVGG
jgi:hypothetical protein